MTHAGIAKNAYRFLLNASAACLGAKRTKIVDARLRFGRRIDIDNPKTLADKICWLEFNNYKDNQLVARCTSKVEVRGYLTERGLGEYLVPLCCEPWMTAFDIDIDALPNSFVMKAAHGCAMNKIVEDKAIEDAGELRTTALNWLAESYARACIEPHYLNVPHAVLCEQLIASPKDIVDYKIHCLNGIPRFVQTCSERSSGLKEGLYDTEWTPIEGLKGIAMKPEPRPSRLPLMLQLAKTVSDDFPYVRVDFYEVDNKVYFGELTFSPATGVLPHFTDAFIARYGTMLEV